MRILTVAVPAYNAGRYLDTCLSSLILEGHMHRYEVIVVDDGSTDNTAMLAEGYAARYPDTFRLISKENGGHGSGINTAVRAARGTYFKVVDADDWVVHLSEFLDALEDADADAVIAGYQTVHISSGRVMDLPAGNFPSIRDITLSELLADFDALRSCCSFHGLAYRTKTYLDHGITLTEGIFYKDQEYACLPFSYVETIRVLPFFFYHYQIGNAEQSVAFPNQVRRIRHIETVVCSILTYMQSHPLRPEAREYFLRKLCVVAVRYFSTALVKNPRKKEGREQAAAFAARLAELEPELLRRTERKRRTLLWMNYVHVPPRLYQGLLDTPLYKLVRAFWTR